MKNYVTCDVRPCSPVKVNRRLGRKYLFHLQGLRVTQASLLSSSCQFLAWLTLQPWGLKRNVLPKRRFTFTGLHDVMLQRSELLITSTVRPTGPTQISLKFTAFWRWYDTLFKTIILYFVHYLGLLESLYLANWSCFCLQVKTCFGGPLSSATFKTWTTVALPRGPGK
jgi:hypothetical protein